MDFRWSYEDLTNDITKCSQDVMKDLQAQIANAMAVEADKLVCDTMRSATKEAINTSASSISLDGLFQYQRNLIKDMLASIDTDELAKKDKMYRIVQEPDGHITIHTRGKTEWELDGTTVIEARAKLLGWDSLDTLIRHIEQYHGFPFEGYVPTNLALN